MALSPFAGSRPGLFAGDWNCREARLKPIARHL